VDNAFTFFTIRAYSDAMLSEFWHRVIKNIHPYHSLAFSFLVLTATGTLLLSLPVSQQGPGARWIDCLFVATSATCVTGLVPVDIAAVFSRFGQVVILLLFQCGGLGIMTFSIFFAYILAGRLSLRGRDVIEHSVSSQPVPYLGALLKFAVIGTLTLEILGAIVLTFRFLPDHSWQHALWSGVFHAVSAFCNAGFSLYADGLMPYRDDVILNLTVMALIVSGGIGFLVLHDLGNIRKKGLRGLTLHSKIVLTVTGLLILIGAAAIMFFELGHTLRPLTAGQKLLASFFQSITARTAGFNTLPIGEMTNGALLVLILLMAIGASPGSTGGGIKTTTFAVIFISFFARLRTEQQLRLFNRGISDTTISKSIGIAIFWIMAVCAALFLLLITESYGSSAAHARGRLVELVFESFSAIGTVGLSMGATPHLSPAGKLVIIVLMYVGRIGPITLALAIANKPALTIRYAEEKIIVG